MINKIDKNHDRKKRHIKVRAGVSGTAERPRLNVYRSKTNIYVQIIDDDKGNTLVSSSSIAKDADAKNLNGILSAKAVGADAAKKALEKGIKRVVFDRGGYLYTGRVKALADGAREAGLEF